MSSIYLPVRSKNNLILEQQTNYLFFRLRFNFEVYLLKSIYR